MADAIHLEDDAEEKEEEHAERAGCSILHSPILISSNQKQTADEEEPLLDAERSSSPVLTMSVKSSFWEVGKKTAETMRDLLTTRETVRSTASELHTLKSSLEKHETTMDKLNSRHMKVSQDATIAGEKKLEIFERCNEAQGNC